MNKLKIQFHFRSLNILLELLSNAIFKCNSFYRVLCAWRGGVSNQATGDCICKALTNGLHLLERALMDPCIRPVLYSFVYRKCSVFGPFILVIRFIIQYTGPYECFTLQFRGENHSETHV